MPLARTATAMTPQAGAVFAIAIAIASPVRAHRAHSDNHPAPPESSFAAKLIVPAPEPGAPGSVDFPVWHTRAPAQRPVLLLHGVTSLSPLTLDLALDMERWGYRVYLHDPVAPIEKFDALRELLTRRGLEDRFETIVLLPGNRDRDAESVRWTVVGTTTQRRTLTLPHSTITAAANPEDRRWFRERLRAALARSR